MKNKILWWVIGIFSLIIIILGLALWAGDGELNSTAISISAFVVGWIIFLFLYFTKDARAEAKAEQAKIEYEEQALKRYQASVRTGEMWAAQQFYNDCVQAGIKDTHKESDRARLELYAHSKGIAGTKDELVIAFNKGRVAVINIAAENRLSKLRMEEKAIGDENRKYSSQHGRDKRIVICQDMIRECERKIAECTNRFNSVNSAASAVYNGYKQKESDWAVLGGMASGIAGGAAGVATAIDVQQRNSEKRAYNQQLGSAVGQLAGNSIMQITQEKSNAESRKNHWEQSLEKAQRALFEDLPADTLMSCLAFHVEQKKKSETGAVRLKINVKQKKELFVYGDASAVVDGCVQVLVVDDNKTVAKGVLTFPYSGSSTYGDDFDVVCFNNAPVPQNYKVRFEPYNIWAIEKL